jgi:hypothetical protein
MVPPASPDPEEEANFKGNSKKALLIGNSSYQIATKLLASKHNVKDMSKALEPIGFKVTKHQASKQAARPDGPAWTDPARPGPALLGPARPGPALPGPARPNNISSSGQAGRSTKFIGPGGPSFLSGQPGPTFYRLFNFFMKSNASHK